MISAADMAVLSRAQDRTIGMASRDLRGMFGRLDLNRPEMARDALLEGFPAVADQYGDISSTASAEWYEQVRGKHAAAGFTATTVALNVEKLERTVRWAAGGLFNGAPGGVLSALEGSLARSLGDASRDTIVENTRRDPDAVGWSRYARPDGCNFCVMLSHRLGVYKRATASFASHDNCRCTAAPSWDPDAPEVPVQAYEASDRMESVRRRAVDPNLSPRDRAKAQEVLALHRQTTNEWLSNQEERIEEFRESLQ